jgi:ribosomal protein S12 methylthiotransferase
MQKKVGVVSLGCDKNLVDTEIMLGILKSEGFEITTLPEEADILIVNTCGFIKSAKQETINTILEFAQYKKNRRNLILIATGCFVQRYKKVLEKEFPEVDVFLGVSDYHYIVNAIKEALKGKKVMKITKPNHFTLDNIPRVRSTSASSAYVKISEGCNNNCSYCVIPKIKGKFKSRPMETILKEVNELVEQGIKEIIFIGQDTTKYGEDLYGDYKLPLLLQKTAEIKDVGWIRILYCYPDSITDELIDVMANEEKICKYLDIPFQHCSDNILKKMNRSITRKDIEKLIKKLREKIPNITLRSTFIIGFPGETKEHFMELLDFLKENKLDRVGMFTYSREEGTAAAKMPFQVPERIKKIRLNKAMKLQKQISLEKNRQLVGRKFKVLVEGSTEKKGWYYGRSERDAPDIDGFIYFYSQNCSVGDFVMVNILHGLEYDLIGEMEDVYKSS